MSARGATAARPRPRPRPRPAPRREGRPAPRPRRVPTRSRPRLGLLLVPLIALLLGGIVWVNVAKLTLTTETSRVVERSRQIESETVRLKAQLEQRDGAVVDLARVRLGMEQVAGDEVTYLDPPAASSSP